MHTSFHICFRRAPQQQRASHRDSAIGSEGCVQRRFNEFVELEKNVQAIISYWQQSTQGATLAALSYCD